jgi:Protein of unknown function (DUF3575)
MKKIFTIFSMFLSFCLFGQNDTFFIQTPEKDTLLKKDRDVIQEIQNDIEKNNKQKLENNTPSVERVRVEKMEKPKFLPPLKQYNHEISVESGALLSQLFRLFGLVRDTQRFPTSPYWFAYKWLYKEGRAVRAGVGADFKSFKDRLGDFADNKKTTIWSFDTRLGYEFQKRLAEHWAWTYGMDAYFGQFKDKTVIDSGFDVNTDIVSGTSFGFGLVMGIRYDFNSRVSIGSEMSLSTLRTNSSEKRFFTANPQFDQTKFVSNETKTRFVGPSNLYLSIRF